MPSLAKLDQLRASIRKLAPTAPVGFGSAFLAPAQPEPVQPGSARPGAFENALAITPVATGVEALDAGLSIGGLARGRVAEISGLPSSGKTAFVLQLLARETQNGELVAFIDGFRQFYPPAAAALGIDLQRMLLVRPSGDERPTASLGRAAEVIAHTRAFSMIALDWPHDRPMGAALAKRIRNAAQSTGTTLLVLGMQSGVVPGASTRIQSAHRERTAHLRVLKGGCAEATLGLPQHRFDELPGAATAPVLDRALPGEEPGNQM
jgi:hypothetical protein